MPRARHGKLTDSFIEALAPKEGGRERIIRDGALPGFLIRVGTRKRTFELRIEKPPKATRQLGHWPDVLAADARRIAEDLWDRHRRGDHLDGAPKKGEETIATTWPRFKARLEDEGRSRRTIGGYNDIMKRLSDGVKNRPLRELAADPTIMEREVERIREILSKKKRGGFAMSTAAARFVSTVFSFAQLRDPTLHGNPCSAVATVDPKRKDLPILRRGEMKDWWAKVQEIPNEVERWALVFCLLSGLRRGSLETLAWEHLRRPVLMSRAIRIPAPKGGEERAFDLILSRPMLRVLWRARQASRRLHPKHAETWVFAGPKGHIRGDHLPRLGIAANHALRRAYASEGRAAGVPKDSIRRFLNHSGGDITDHYIRGTALGELQLAEQETISAHLAKALGSPPELTVGRGQMS
jgi:integrase